MPNIKSYLRRSGSKVSDDNKSITQSRRKCLTHEERCHIYDEYKQSKESVKKICENNNISVSCLYSRIIPYMAKQNGITESDKNVKILDLKKELGNTVTMNFKNKIPIFSTT